MRAPAAILLDVMGTLVAEPFHTVVPASLGMTMEELLAAKHPTAWMEFERGEIDEATFASRFFSDGRDYPHEEMVRAMVEAYVFLDGIEALLTQLKERGHSMHLLSNYPIWYRLIEDKLELSRFAEWSFVSCEMGVRKPNPAIYTRAAEQLGEPCDRLLFVDDRTENCEAARALGMDAIVFENARQLEAALRQREL